jgi:hypothetical protein
VKQEVAHHVTPSNLRISKAHVGTDMAMRIPNIRAMRKSRASVLLIGSPPML